jgi:hypothetical protein
MFDGCRRLLHVAGDRPGELTILCIGRLDQACASFTQWLWRVNLDARGATIWMRTVSRRVDDAAHLIVAGAIHV